MFLVIVFSNCIFSFTFIMWRWKRRTKVALAKQTSVAEIRVTHNLWVIRMKVGNACWILSWLVRPCYVFRVMYSYWCWHHSKPEAFSKLSGYCLILTVLLAGKLKPEITGKCGKTYSTFFVFCQYFSKLLKIFFPDFRHLKETYVMRNSSLWTPNIISAAQYLRKSFKISITFSKWLKFWVLALLVISAEEQ